MSTRSLAFRAAVDRQEMESLRQVFQRLDRKNDGVIDADEIASQLVRYGYRPKKVTEYGNSEVEDILWECDDEGTGCITWDAFQSLYLRCRRDKSGNEPKRLYNLSEFMMLDNDGNGVITHDECMQTMFNRYGPDMLDEMTNEFFKADKDSDKNVSFPEFMDHMEARKLKNFAQEEVVPAPPSSPPGPRSARAPRRPATSASSSGLPPKSGSQSARMVSPRTRFAVPSKTSLSSTMRASSSSDLPSGLRARTSR